MKKTLTTIGALTLLATTGFIAYAEPLTTDGTGTATFTAGKLSINKDLTALDFRFEGTVEEAFSGIALPELNENLQITVEDFRGGQAGWTLYVEKTPWGGLAGSELIIGSVNTSTRGITYHNDIVLNYSQQPVMSASGDYALVATATLEDVILDLIPTTIITAPQYTTELTWTLVNGPDNDL